MSSLTRYMSKATPAHLTYAKVVLRYLIGIKKRLLTWCGQRVSLPHILGEILAFVDSSWADDKNNSSYGLISVRQQCDLFMACYPLADYCFKHY